MIKFYGSLSDDNKKVIICKEKKIFFLVAMIAVIFGICLTITLAIKINSIYLLFLFPLIIFLLFPLLPLKQKTLDLIIPLKITLNTDIIISEGYNFKCIKRISDIKKVIDYGSYYFIYFKWPKKSYKFLCQKDLIIKGTITEFEEAFKDKIVRKT